MKIMAKSQVNKYAGVHRECKELVDRLNEGIDTYLHNMVIDGLFGTDDLDIVEKSAEILYDAAAYAKYRSDEDDDDLNNWSIDDYFKYLYDVHNGNVEEACMDIEYSWGNEDLPSSISKMDWKDIQNKFISWVDEHHK